MTRSRMPHLPLVLPFVFLVLLAPLVKAQTTNEDCLSCHSDESLTTERGGKEHSLFVNAALLKQSPHAKLSCVACHTGFDKDNIPHKENITPIKCLTCHNDAPRKHAFHPNMVRATGTNGTPDISCKTCHGRHDVVSSEVPGSKFSKGMQTQTCGKCHADAQHDFLTSAHAKALSENAPGAPTCVTCHSIDIVLAKNRADSAATKIAQEKVCLSCHLDDPNVRARTSPTSKFIASYENSVHGKALQEGNARAANCVNCHGSHEMKKGLDPGSRVNKTHIPETCAGCHSQASEEFKESVHGLAAARGNKDAPVCTDCHGEHNILAPSDPESRVAARNISRQVCSPCHSSVKLSEKYGLASDRFKTFSDSYHGLANEAGSIEVANCSSCHRNHDIRRSNDPGSSVNKANLAKTCGSCHPGANERFAIGTVHVAMDREEEPLLYWVSTVYIVLIVSVVGGMAAHNIPDFIRKSRRRILIRRGILTEEHHGRGLYVRMTMSERLQHGSLLVSFITLVITGFMLRYPEAWWVATIRGISDSVFDLRGILHRIASVVLVAAGLYHIYYLLFTERGKALFRALMPRWQDITDAVAVLKYNLGLSPHKPSFGRFSYVEKSEYWALVWGTAIMGVTGVILWFDNTFLGLLTKLGWDVARTIHFYEAWLATLAIIVWHFYFVLLNPDIYPMNMAWITGTLSEAEMADEHPLELEKTKKEEGYMKVEVEKESKVDVQHPQKRKEKGLRNP